MKSMLLQEMLHETRVNNLSTQLFAQAKGEDSSVLRALDIDFEIEGETSDIEQKILKLNYQVDLIEA